MAKLVSNFEKDIIGSTIYNTQDDAKSTATEESEWSIIGMPTPMTTPEKSPPDPVPQEENIKTKQPEENCVVEVASGLPTPEMTPEKSPLPAQTPAVEAPKDKTVRPNPKPKQEKPKKNAARHTVERAEMRRKQQKTSR